MALGDNGQEPLHILLPSSNVYRSHSMEVQVAVRMAWGELGRMKPLVEMREELILWVEIVV